MEDLFTFATKYYDEGNVSIDKFLPRLQVRLRDELCLKGRKIPYEDFTKVIKRGNSYTPLVCCQGAPKSDETVIDFTSLINVGVAEIITLLSHENDAVGLKFLGWAHELPIADDWYDMLDCAGKMFGITPDDNMPFMLSEALRSSLIDYRFPLVRRIYSAMQILHWVNPKSYCVALIEALKLSFSVISVFMCPPEDFEVSGYPNQFSNYEEIVKSRLSRCGAIEYKLEGSDKIRKITDGRGLGISAMTMFLMDLYNRFGEFRGTEKLVPIHKEKYRIHIQGVFEKCLGDDFAGRYVRNGRCFVMDCPRSIVMLGNDANFLTMDCHDGMKWHDISVGRGVYEGHLLWKYAVGADNITNVGVLPPIDCTYGTRVDFLHALLGFVYSDRGMRMNRNLIKKDEDKLVDAVLKNMDADSILETYKQDLVNAANDRLNDMQKIVNEKVSEAQAAIKAKEDAERSLSEKSHIVDELRAEVASLRTKVRSIYSDSDLDSDEAECHETKGVVTENVSTEEMLALVNQFRLIVVGGRDTMQQRLEQAGFTNFYCISSERASNSTLVSGDFFCLCTKFLSHKLAYNVEVHYSDQSDHFFYFNGTNVDAFLRTCYEFITDWFGDGGGSPDET